MADGVEDINIARAEFGEVFDNNNPELDDVNNQRRNLEMLYDVPLHVTVRLGETQISIRELLSLGPGAVVELERLAGESVDLLVNGVLVGKGDVVVVNENFGLRITDVVSTEERLKNL